jgi:methylated-DNA-[protein]-cysteine S-methyltransferase
MTVGFALFETAIGACGIAWHAAPVVDGRKQAIVLLQLPEADRAATRARIRRRCPDAREAEPPADIRGAMERIAALMRGGQDDLRSIPLDMSAVPAFHRKVYEATRAIPPGATLTYGEIAARIGEPGAAQAVGQALGANPFAPVVPCHRVLAADGRMNGFSAHGGVATKRRMLEIEGALAYQPSLFDDRP